MALTKEEIRLHLLKKKKIGLTRLIEKVEKQIRDLSETIKETLQYKDFVKYKFCIVCANRDPELDFRIPDGIVCTHPCNQNGKDKFRCYSHTCENWKLEKRD